MSNPQSWQSLLCLQIFYCTRCLVFVVAVLLFIAADLSAQDATIFRPDSIRKELHATEINTMLRINGVPNEEAWKSATTSPAFVQIEPFQGSRPNHATEVKVLYNKKYLYFAIFSRDSLGRKAIRAVDFKRDFSQRQHDLITMSFDAFNDNRNAIALSTNPYGVQRDYLSFDDLYFDNDWDGLWRVRTSRTDSGWVAEIAVPWKTLRYPQRGDSIQEWGFNVFRNRRLTNETSALSPYPRAYTSTRMAYAGVLKNLKPPRSTTNIRAVPYFLTSYDKIDDGSTKMDKVNYKVGGELKWALSPHAILDLTANTDFAQADADRQVNNVTRFSVFFPERRQFFLENASLFGIGVAPADDGSLGSMRVQPFFSRRIGLDAKGNPVPIDAGGRFVYRSSKQNLGAIVMRQRATNEEPATNFFVGRYSKNIGTQNRMGGMVSVKDQNGNTNITSTIDGFVRLKTAHSINAMAIHTLTTQTGSQGFAGFAQYQYLSNQTKIWLTESVVTKNFNPEMGFVSRTDVIGTTPGINFYYRGKNLPFKKILRAYEPGVLPEMYLQASTGKLIELQIPIFPVWLNLQRGGYLGYGANPTYQFLTEAFEPLGVSIEPGSYNYIRNQVWFSTDQSRVISVQGLAEWGTYFDGRLTTFDWKLLIAPIPHFSITGRFNRNHFYSVGEDDTTVKVDYYSVEGRFAMNPRIQLIGFYQRNSENDSENYNIRLALEYLPLSYIYLVYNHGVANNADPLASARQRQDHFIAKISLLKQF
ncbi:MAG: DUF5916 domain-containing protein [Chryseolinea sp.]